MELFDIYCARIMSGLQKILYDDNACLFSYSSRDTFAELSRMKSELEAGHKASDVLKSSIFNRAELKHYITLSGYCESDTDELEIVESHDMLLFEAVSKAANAMLGDLVFVVSTIRFKKAYLGNMCVHHYVEIEFGLSSAKLSKLI